MTSRSYMRRLAPAVASFTFLAMIPSCATLQQNQAAARAAIDRGGGGAAKKDKFMKDQNRTMTEGAVAGAAVGTGAGLLLRERFGAAGVVGGAIAGGLLGLGVGAAVANKKAVLQQEDSNIDAAINSALAANRQARNRVAGLTAELNALKRRAARAKSAGNAREIQKIKAEATALRTKFEKSDAEVEACIERSGSLAKQMGQKHSKYAAMKSGVAELQQTRSEASNGKKEIASLLSTL